MRCCNLLQVSATSCNTSQQVALQQYTSTDDYERSVDAAFDSANAITAISRR